MIQITCPSNNIPERTYAIEALLTDVMGVEREEYEISFKDDTKDYVLQYDNRTVVVEDHFFNRFTEPLSYLYVENIPSELHFYHALGLEIPIIYGEDKFAQDADKIIIGLDIFASTFFMLTRWEEFLIGREETGNCKETMQFAFLHGIHCRPIVNEYAELLLKFLSSEIKIKSRDYKVILTHDVDGLLTPTWRRIIKDFVHQTRFGEPKNKILNLTWKEEIKYKMAFPYAYRQFEMYTDLAERYGIEEWFYIKVCAKGEEEDTYWYNDKQTINVVRRLRNKGKANITLGFHPSQSVFNDKEQWDAEVRRVTSLLGEVPRIGRNHHLIYNGDMLRWWEGVSEKAVDISNCVFHNYNGFRSGVCVPYHCFDVSQRRTMNLIEHPNQVMDTVIRYDAKKKTEDEISREIKNIVSQIKKYNGEMILTWHIYIRNRKLIQDYYNWCERSINYSLE